MLVGGSGWSTWRTEILKENGDTAFGFELGYNEHYSGTWRMYACLIGEEETVTMTGGSIVNVNSVNRYQMDGSFEKLPNLNHGRIHHACGHFTRTDGSVV